MDEKLHEVVKDAAPLLALARSEEKKKKQQTSPSGSGVSMQSFTSLAERSLILAEVEAKGPGKDQSLMVEDIERREADLMKLASCLSHFDLEFKPLGGRVSSKAKGGAGQTSSSAEDRDRGWVGGAFGGQSMEPEGETERLLALSLQVSQALARTRAVNKASIAQAISQSEAGDRLTRI